jgi:hypothetical protein
LLSRAELTGIRDRSRARNDSASRAEFRREQERRRAFGLQRRHAERLRHVRERQAGCWPTDLRVTAAAVEGTQPGIPDPPRSSTTRPTPPVPQPAPSCDPRAGQGSQAGPVQQTRPAGKPCREPHSTPLPTPRPARPNHGYRTAALSRHQTPNRDCTPATDRTGGTTPRQPARPPDPAQQANTKPEQPGPARSDPTCTQPATGNKQSTTRTPNGTTIPALLKNVFNTRRDP